MKRIKGTLQDVLQLDINYYAFQKIKTVEGVPGVRYILEKPLTDEQREQLNAWRNFIISSCYNRYAPEQTHDVIIIFNKVVRS